MAVHLATASDYLQRTTDLLDPTTDSTVMGWTRAASVSLAAQTAYFLADDPNIYGEYVGVFLNTATGSLDASSVASGFDTIHNDPPSDGVWFHWAWVQSGITQRYYINGTLIGAVTVDRGAAIVGFESLGSDTYTDGGVDLAWFRSWQAALTIDQIQSEMWRSTAGITADLFADTPLDADGADVSGNGRDWTIVGTATFDNQQATLDAQGPKQPLRWLFFALDTVPPTYPVPTFRWAQQPLAMYGLFPAFIEGRIPVDGWGEVQRAASTMQGEYSVDHASATINDVDAQIRALMDEFGTQWFIRRIGSFLLLSGAAFQAGLVPRLLMAGPCSDLQLADDRKAQIEFSDLFEPYLDKTYPQYYMRDAYPWRVTEQDSSIDADLDTNDPELQLANVMRDQVLCIYYGPHVNTKINPITGVPDDGMCAVFYAGQTFLSSGGGGDEPTPEQAAILNGLGLNNGEGWGGWGELFVAAGEIDTPNVYGHNLSATDPASTLISEDRFGTEFLFPGHANWPFATNYVIRNGFLVTVGYARGPALWSHLTGGPQITVDVCGWKSKLNGLMIEQTFPSWQDFVTQHVFANDGAGFIGGPQVDLPTFDPTISEGRAKFWTSKIQEAQALSARRLGNDVGYIRSMALTKPTTLREIDRKDNRSFGCFTAKNGAGQLYKFLINDLPQEDSGIRIREWIEIRGPLPSPTIDWQAIENSIDFTIGWHPRLDKPRTIVLNKTAPQIYIDALKGEVRKSQDGVRNLEYTADDATGNDVVGRWLILLREPPRMQPLPLGTEGVDRELGEEVPVTHRDGFGPNGIGYSERPMVLMQHAQKGDDVTLVGLDVHSIQDVAGVWADDDVPDFGAATAEEQAANGFWTDDDGTIDGERGSEWR